MYLQREIQRLYPPLGLVDKENVYIFSAGSDPTCMLADIIQRRSSHLT